MSKKKKEPCKKQQTKSKCCNKTKSCSKNKCNREKAFGDAAPVVPCGEKDNQIYPRLFLHQDSLWTKIKRLFRCVP